MLEAFEVTTLTPEQIQTLQADEALRIMGMIDFALAELNKELISANDRYFEAKRHLDNLKNTKSTLVERARVLKTLVQHS